MAQKTQGTNFYTIDPADGTILEVGCVINLDGFDTTLDQLETTCLSMSAREYVAGLATPGAGSFQVNFDPQDASHVRLHQLKKAGTVLPWAIGFGNGTAPPTVDSNGDFVLPATRAWLTFEGFMNSYPFSLPLNALVTSNIGLQISGDITVTPKSP